MMLAMLDEQPDAPEESLDDLIDAAQVATMDFLAEQGQDADARQLEAEIQHLDARA